MLMQRVTGFVLLFLRTSVVLYFLMKKLHSCEGNFYILAFNSSLICYSPLGFQSDSLLACLCSC